MSILSAADLADLQAIDESAMPDTCTLTTVTRVSDGAGAYTETTSTSTSACRFWSVTGAETAGDVVRALGSHRLALPLATTVPAQEDRVTVRGKVYQVKYIFPRTGHSTSTVLGLEEAA